MGLWGRQEIANAQLGRLHFGRWGPIESAQLVVRPGRVFEGIMESWSLDVLNGHHQSFRMLPIVIFLLNLHTFGSLGAFVWSLGGDDPLMALASSPLKDQRKLASHDINYW